jgi:hypothetical protein
MTLSEIEKENSGDGFSKHHNERKDALVQGLSHPNSRLKQHGVVKFDEKFVSFAAIVVFQRDALHGTCFDGYVEHYKEGYKRIFGEDLQSSEQNTNDDPCEIEPPDRISDEVRVLAF